MNIFEEIKKNNIEYIKEYINSGKDLDINDENGNSVLNFAIINNKIKIVRLLLSVANRSKIDKKLYKKISSEYLDDKINSQNDKIKKIENDLLKLNKELSFIKDKSEQVEFKEKYINIKENELLMAKETLKRIEKRKKSSNINDAIDDSKKMIHKQIEKQKLLITKSKPKALIVKISKNLVIENNNLKAIKQKMKKSKGEVPQEIKSEFEKIKQNINKLTSSKNNTLNKFKNDPEFENNAINGGDKWSKIIKMSNNNIKYLKNELESLSYEVDEIKNNLKSSLNGNDFIIPSKLLTNNKIPKHVKSILGTHIDNLLNDSKFNNVIKNFSVDSAKDYLDDLKLSASRLKRRRRKGFIKEYAYSEIEDISLNMSDLQNTFLVNKVGEKISNIASLISMGKKVYVNAMAIKETTKGVSDGNGNLNYGHFTLTDSLFVNYYRDWLETLDEETRASIKKQSIDQVVSVEPIDIKKVEIDDEVLDDSEKLDNIISSVSIDDVTDLNLVNNILNNAIVSDSTKYLPAMYKIDKNKSFSYNILNADLNFIDFIYLQKKYLSKVNSDNKFYHKNSLGGVINQVCNYYSQADPSKNRNYLQIVKYKNYKEYRIRYKDKKHRITVLNNVLLYLFSSHKTRNYYLFDNKKDNNLKNSSVVSIFYELLSYDTKKTSKKEFLISGLKRFKKNFSKSNIYKQAVADLLESYKKEKIYYAGQIIKKIEITHSKEKSSIFDLPVIMRPKKNKLHFILESILKIWDEIKEETTYFDKYLKSDDLEKKMANLEIIAKHCDLVTDGLSGDFINFNSKEKLSEIPTKLNYVFPYLKIFIPYLLNETIVKDTPLKNVDLSMFKNINIFTDETLLVLREIENRVLKVNEKLKEYSPDIDIAVDLSKYTYDNKKEKILIESSNNSSQQGEKVKSKNFINNEKYINNNISLNVFYENNENPELSNLARRPFTIPQKNAITNGYKEATDGEELVFQSVESAFQAMKILFVSDNKYFNNEELTTEGLDFLEEISVMEGLKAREFGNNTIKDLDFESWNKQYPTIMSLFIYWSFEQNPKKKEILLNTGNKKITQTQDTSYMGTLIPKLLMETRNKFRNGLSAYEQVKLTPTEENQTIGKQYQKYLNRRLSEFLTQSVAPRYEYNGDKKTLLLKDVISTKHTNFARALGYLTKLNVIRGKVEYIDDSLIKTTNNITKQIITAIVDNIQEIEDISDLKDFSINFKTISFDRRNDNSESKIKNTAIIVNLKEFKKEVMVEALKKTSKKGFDKSINNIKSFIPTASEIMALLGNSDMVGEVRLLNLDGNTGIFIDELGNYISKKINRLGEKDRAYLKAVFDYEMLKVIEKKEGKDRLLKGYEWVVRTPKTQFFSSNKNMSEIRVPGPLDSRDYFNYQRTKNFQSVKTWLTNGYNKIGKSSVSDVIDFLKKRLTKQTIGWKIENISSAINILQKEIKNGDKSIYTIKKGGVAIAYIGSKINKNDLSSGDLIEIDLTSTSPFNIIVRTVFRDINKYKSNTLFKVSSSVFYEFYNKYAKKMFKIDINNSLDKLEIKADKINFERLNYIIKRFNNFYIKEDLIIAGYLPLDIFIGDKLSSIKSNKEISKLNEDRILTMTEVAKKNAEQNIDFYRNYYDESFSENVKNRIPVLDGKYSIDASVDEDDYFEDDGNHIKLYVDDIPNIVNKGYNVGGSNKKYISVVTNAIMEIYLKKIDLLSKKDIKEIKNNPVGWFNNIVKDKEKHQKLISFNNILNIYDDVNEKLKILISSIKKTKKENTGTLALMDKLVVDITIKKEMKIDKEIMNDINNAGIDSLISFLLELLNYGKLEGKESLYNSIYFAYIYNKIFKGNYLFTAVENTTENINGNDLTNYNETMEALKDSIDNYLSNDSRIKNSMNTIGYLLKNYNIKNDITQAKLITLRYLLSNFDISNLSQSVINLRNEINNNPNLNYMNLILTDNTTGKAIGSFDSEIIRNRLFSIKNASPKINAFYHTMVLLTDSNKKIFNKEIFKNVSEDDLSTAITLFIEDVLPEL